jgi:hypothetical protein
MSESDVEFLLMCLAFAILFALAMAVGFCFIFAEKMYVHRRRGYTFCESFLAALEELES